MTATLTIEQSSLFQLGRVAGDSDRPEGGATSRAILTGHEAPITALAVSAEHGLVISGCAGEWCVVREGEGWEKSPWKYERLGGECLGFNVGGSGAVVGEW